MSVARLQGRFGGLEEEERISIEQALDAIEQEEAFQLNKGMKVCNYCSGWLPLVAFARRFRSKPRVLVKNGDACISCTKRCWFVFGSAFETFELQGRVCAAVWDWVANMDRPLGSGFVGSGSDEEFEIFEGCDPGD